MMGVDGCSKGEAERLLRKLIVLHVLVEETFRQDNQYQSVSSALRVNNLVAARLASGKKPDASALSTVVNAYLMPRAYLTFHETREPSLAPKQVSVAAARPFCQAGALGNSSMRELLLQDGCPYLNLEEVDLNARSLHI